MTDLALADEGTEGAERLHQRSVQVVLVCVIQVNAVDPQPPQRVIDALPDRRLGQPRALRGHAHLRGEDELIPVPARGDPATDDPLRLARSTWSIPPVAVGGDR